jgi:hypothetical protein
VLLLPKDGSMTGLAAFWPADAATVLEDMARAVHAQRKKRPGELRLYLIYRQHAPASPTIQKWRAELGCEIIPLLASMLERALAQGQYAQQLKELEEPYLVRADPYAEFKPVTDPAWFYGRGELMERLPAALAQGQHVGLFGLRKVGKTSLVNQLRQRFVATPAVSLDCQALPARAESYFDAIYRELHAEMGVQGIPRLPMLHKITDAEDFQRSFVALFECWEKAGQREPFLIILDEIDKLLPNPGVHGRDETLAEYVRLFRVLRGLAQTRQCLVLLVIAYRPAVSRQNLLGPAVGENPMFNSFQEQYLGFLSPAESEALDREIGLWKNIVWEEEAARRVFQSCGGHPLITRYFASHACRKGALRQPRLPKGRVEERHPRPRARKRHRAAEDASQERDWQLLSRRHLGAASRRRAAGAGLGCSERRLC